MNLRAFFEQVTRNDGSKIWTKSDACPEWLADAIQEAHNGDLPNDWIYEECRAACAAIEDGELTTDDDVHEFSDSRVDVYTKVLFQWQADMCLSSTYSEAEGEASELGSDTSDMVKAVSIIQYCAIRSIAAGILAAYEEVLETAE